MDHRSTHATTALSRRLATLLAIALLALAVAGCGADDDGGSDDVPSGAIATIGYVEIGKDDLDEQVDALARAQQPAHGAKTSTKARREQLEAQALSMLLLREALEQEAADRDIEVSIDEARARWEPIASRQFKTKKALRRFLGGQTEADLLAQLRLQVLAERIHEQVSEQAGGGKQGAKAVEQFQKDFQKRWQDRAVCADGYTATGCNEDKTE